MDCLVLAISVIAHYVQALLQGELGNGWLGQAKF